MLVKIYTDGACSGNPGKGGYGTILVYNGNRKELSAGYQVTTNNRMELMGVIAGFEALNQPCEVTLVSDPKYVIDALSLGWAEKWRANGWMRNKKEKAQNPDLWQRLFDTMAGHSVEYRWVKGHAGHAENERCDFLAVSAYQRKNLLEDTEYNNSK